MSSLSSNSHDTKCSNDRKTTTFGLLFNFQTCDFFDDEEVVHLVFHFEKKKIFQVEMKKNFLSLFLVYKIWINRNTSGVYNKVREDYSLLTWNTNTSGDGCLWPCCPSAKTNDHGLLHIHKLSGSWCVSTLFSRRGQQPYGRRLGLETIAPSAMFCLYL